MTRGVRARLIGSLLAATVVLTPGLLVPAAASAQPTTPTSSSRAPRTSATSAAT
ncbi:hypothetical protein [Rhodococcus sp. MTM3W5.2]|uniref:hypothetical protein n=1 Tax=Rhodococcus sp. MTM3W5.2 TaxID=1805827 RepID=UPI001CB8EC51|nr:hypothetical protein [Rhodococcus sp. MTM3W5.2]